MTERALHGIWLDWTTAVRFRAPGEDAGEAEEALEELLESPDAVRAVQLECAANALEDGSLSGAVDLVCSGDAESPEEGTEIGALDGDLSPKALAERARKAERALSEKVTEMRFGNIVARRSGFLGPDGRPGLMIGYYDHEDEFAIVATVVEGRVPHQGITVSARRNEQDDESCVDMRRNGEKPERAGR